MSILQGPMRQHLNSHKEDTENKEVLRNLDPDFVWIPLVNGRAVCKPLVNVGDEVKVGTKIAERNDHFYLPLFSSVSGKVVGIEKFLTSGMIMADHLKIENDHKYEKVQAFEPLDYTKASWQDLYEFVKNAGVMGQGGAGFPTYAKYTNPDNCKVLIINALEGEPYLTGDLKEAQLHEDQLKTGVLALLKLSKAEHAVVAVKESRTTFVELLKNVFDGTDVEIRPIKDFYNRGWERSLIYVLTGKRYDKLPIEAGCIVDNSTTAIRIGNALLNGMPITEKVVTVAGNALNNEQCVMVPTGTKAKEVIKAAGGYKDGIDDVLLIAGGPMMGRTIPNDEFAMGPCDGGLTVLKTEPVDTLPCLHCGKCTEVCPAGLEPVQIAFGAKTGNVELLEKLHTMDCVECGICAYICPSKIDVTENVRRGKRLLMLRAQQNKKA